MTGPRSADDAPGTPGTPVAALQQALAAEHAATWVLGFLGARVSTSESPVLAERLVDAFEAHRAARDALVVQVARSGAEPVASLVDYEVPSPARSADELRAAARTVEERVVATYAEVVSRTAGDDRRVAITGLRDSAVRALGFGAAPTDLPGLQ